MHWLGMVLVSNAQEAKKIASVLLHQKLAGCVNIIPRITSGYWWKNKIRFETETMVLFKTTKKKIAQAIQTIEKHHSYDTPVIDAWPVQKMNPAAQQWLEKELK